MIVLLLFISNVATIIVAVSIWGLIKDQSYYVWLWINGLSLAVLGSAHSVAYWLFAWEYYKIATLMPFALKNDDLPYSIEEKINTTFIALNLIFNIASGFLVIGWTYYQNKIWFTFLIVFQ
jgi:hypothetical protein